MRYTDKNINGLRVYRIHNPWMEHIGRNAVWYLGYPCPLGSNKCTITFQDDKKNINIVEYYDIQLVLHFLNKDVWYPVKENWFQKFCRYVRRSYGSI